MPLYEYLCQDCDYEFEVLRSFSAAEDAAHCLRCEGQSTQRKISRFAALLADEGGSARPPAGGGCCRGSGGCACSMN